MQFKKASNRLRLLKKIRQSLTMDAAETINKCTIMPLLAYSNVVTFNLNDSQISRVQNLQEIATRIIKIKESAHIRIPELMNFAKFQCCILVRQCIDKNACSNFNNYFELLQHAKNTRINRLALESQK